METKTTKKHYLLLILGVGLMIFALLLDGHVPMSDFLNGLIFGIGLGLLILYIVKRSKFLGSKD